MPARVYQMRHKITFGHSHKNHLSLTGSHYVMEEEYKEVDLETQNTFQNQAHPTMTRELQLLPSTEPSMKRTKSQQKNAGIC